MSISSSTLGNTRQKYKLVFLGDQSVGKSSMIERYITNSYDESLNPTVGIDFYIKNVTRNNRQYRLQLWDTAGQERFRSLIPSYMKDADCAIMVYDVSSKRTLENLQIWNSMFEEYRQASAIKLVIGNKIDLSDRREVQKSEAEKFAQRMGAHYLEVSAKTGKRLDQTFMLAIDSITQKYEERNRLIKQMNDPEKGAANNADIKDPKDVRPSQQSLINGNNGKNLNFKLENDPLADGVPNKTDSNAKIAKSKSNRKTCCQS